MGRQRGSEKENGNNGGSKKVKGVKGQQKKWQRKDANENFIRQKRK